MAVAKLHFPIIGLAVFWGGSIVFLYSSIGLYKFILKPAVFSLHISCYACQLIYSCQHLFICCFDNNALSLCQIIKNFNKIELPEKRHLNQGLFCFISFFDQAFLSISCFFALFTGISFWFPEAWMFCLPTFPWVSKLVVTETESSTTCLSERS